MKKWLIGVLTIVLFMCVPTIKSSAVTVSTIVGVVGNCDTVLAGCNPIPLTITTLCTVTCPTRTAPSFTSTTRIWGDVTTTCVSSVDGGLTWPNCASQPGADGNNYEYVAETANGSVIAAGRDGGNVTCLIRQSTNTGTSWTTVMSVAGNCSNGGARGQRLFCLSDGRCEWLVFDITSTSFVTFRSSNNGLTWSNSSVAANMCTIASGQWDGSAGVVPSENPGCGGGGVAKTLSAAGDVWTASATWDGTQGDCWGSVIYNGTPRVLCQSSGAPLTANYTLRDTTGANFATLILPNALTTSIDAGGIAHTLKTNVLYVAASTATSTIGVWVSTDNLVTFLQIGTLGGGGAGIREGNAFNANGCIYMTYGFTAAFAKIC